MEKQRGEEAETRSKKKKVGRKQMQVREKVGNSRRAVFFSFFLGSRGSKSTLANWGDERRKSAHRCGVTKICKSKNIIVTALLEVEIWKKRTPLWREARFEIKMVNAPHVRSTFSSSDVQEVHDVAARSTFGSQNAKSIPCSEHF